MTEYKFKSGDKVRRTSRDWMGMAVGDTATVETGHCDALNLIEYGGTHCIESFELVPEVQYPHPPHKHQELIIEWAKGAIIQYLDGDDWIDVTGDPYWNDEDTYRVKPPEPKTPIISEKDKKIGEIEEKLRILADELKAVKEEGE